MGVYISKFAEFKLEYNRLLNISKMYLMYGFHFSYWLLYKNRTNLFENLLNI